MTSRLEDAAGKALMIATYGYMAVHQILTAVAILRFHERVEQWPLVFASRAFGFVFLVMVVYFTFRRLPPKDSATGLEPRLSAIGGTYILSLLVVLPTGSVGAELRVFATLLIAAGTALSAYCIVWLGRSFSIMASARRLVVEGPYRFVRHPLYAAEALTALGTVISNWSPAAALTGLLWCALQYRRMRNEEGVLRASFPEYDDYARRVPMILPVYSGIRTADRSA